LPISLKEAYQLAEKDHRILVFPHIKYLHKSLEECAENWNDEMFFKNLFGNSKLQEMEKPKPNSNLIIPGQYFILDKDDTIAVILDTPGYSASDIQFCFVNDHTIKYQLHSEAKTFEKMLIEEKGFKLIVGDISNPLESGQQFYIHLPFGIEIPSTSAEHCLFSKNGRITIKFKKKNSRKSISETVSL